MINNYNNLKLLNEVVKGQTGTGLLLEKDGTMYLKDETKQQIREDFERGSKLVAPERLTAYAICQRYDVLNHNGRIYPKNVLVPAIEKYINERVKTRCAISALDHPQASTLSGHDVAHLITNMWWEGNTLYGEFDLHLSPGYSRYGICSTSGDLVANMLLQDYLIGVSSRAVGSVKNEGGNLIVDDDLEIIAFDEVLEPSTPGAMMKFNREDLSQFANTTLEDRKIIGNALNEKLDKIEKLLI